MRRDPAALSGSHFDLLVVGAGIYGACAARDAAQRGLTVALIDKGDFGGATSANSQRLIHGGLRYLQKAQLRRMRESIRERRAFLQIAPQLVHPLPCLVPAYGHGFRGVEALGAALLLNDLLSWDRNRGSAADHRIPRGRIVSKEECLRLFPGLAAAGLTGGAIFTDGLMRSPERVTLAFVLSAVEQGAVAANYVRATRLLVAGGAGGTRCVAGALARDEIAGSDLEIRARVVLNAAGPWAGELARQGDGDYPPGEFRHAKGFNVVVDRELVPGMSLGVLGPPDDAVRSGGGPLSWRARGGERRFYFLTPWRGRTVVGTCYAPHAGPPEALRVTAREVEAFLASVNQAYPAGRLEMREVTFVQRGLLPLKTEGRSEIADDHRLFDSAERGGCAGLLTLRGVKYTTARAAAEQAVDRVSAMLGRRIRGRTATTALHGATPEPGPTGAPLRQQVLHAIRAEAAVKLGDVSFRRTDLGSGGPPPEEVLQGIAGAMGEELAWDAPRRTAEVEEVRGAYARPE